MCGQNYVWTWNVGGFVPGGIKMIQSMLVTTLPKPRCFSVNTHPYSLFHRFNIHASSASRCTCTLRKPPQSVVALISCHRSLGAWGHGPELKPTSNLAAARSAGVPAFRAVWCNSASSCDYCSSCCDCWSRRAATCSIGAERSGKIVRGDTAVEVEALCGTD
jgi:hypothetical protein